MADCALVTGGAGFLGSHLCDRLLAGGARVVCLDNFCTGARDNIAHLAGSARFSLIERDAAEAPDDEMIAALAGVTRIFNLACPASPPMYQRDPVFTMRTCVLGALNMLELAERTGARLLHASTSEVYGDPREHPQREDYRGWVNPVGPRACYDEGKRAAETLCADFIRGRGVDARVARIFNTYGPRMRPDDGRVVSTFIRQALAGEPLTVFGDGSQTRSFCYVDDLIEGLIRLMEVEPAPGGPVNLGNPEERSVRDLAGLVIELAGAGVGIDSAPLPEDDPARRRPDISRAKAALGWSPTTPIREGLERTIAWFRGGARAR
ncbi:MAG: SDR family oxidoreductase [Planctomycetota bacterium]|nr:MAG: SDR family oxidoreductase [Planctomycetota bacterium]